MNMKAELQRYELSAPNPFFRASVLRDDHARATIRQIPADLDRDRLFTFPAQISNQNVDSYWTRMASSSLQNYASDASEGVAFLDSHQHHQRIGYSYSGEFVADDNNPAVFADFYTVRGLKLGAMDTDNFIQGVEFGLIRDVSIGFKEGEGFEYTCSICGEDLFDWDVHCLMRTVK